RPSRDSLRAGLIIGGLLYAGFAFQTAGLKLTTPTKSAFLTAMSVVLVPLLQVVIFRERLRGAVVGGVAAAAVGRYFLTMPPGAIRLETGDLLTLACALAFAGHIVALGRYAPRFDVATLAVLQVGAAMLFAALAMPLFDATGVERIFAVPTPRLAVALLVTAGLATAAAFSIQTWAQRITSPTHAAILFTLEPVFAALTSLLVLNERLGGRELLGAGLILAGVLVAELRAVPAPETPGVPAPPASPDADSR
ncbi:MAG: DMT family transporter, partial [Acidobacteria bacterium]|nr:DMT family transporter [Acidobacteriota bacterium]